MWRKVFEYSIITIGGTSVSRAFIFIFNALIIRYLSVEHYGYFAFIFSIYNWTMIIGHLDMYASLSKYVSEKRATEKVEDIWNYYENAIMLGMASTVVGILLSLVLSTSIKIEFWVKVLFFGSLIPTTIKAINEGLFKGYEKFTLSALSEVLLGFSKLALLIIMLVFFKTVTLQSVLIVFSIATLPSAIVGLKIIKMMVKSEHSRLRFKPNVNIMKKLSEFSFWILITDLLNTGILLFTNYSMSYISIQDLAKFNVIILILTIFNICIAALPSVLIPIISKKKSKGEKIKILGIRELIILYMVAMLILIIILFFPYSEDIIRFILKKEIYIDSLKYSAFLLFSLPLRTFTMANKGIVQGLGKPKEVALVAFWTLLFYSVILIPLYRSFGLSGLVIALNLAYFIEFLLNQHAVKKVLKEIGL